MGVMRWATLGTVLALALGAAPPVRTQGVLIEPPSAEDSVASLNAPLFQSFAPLRLTLVTEISGLKRDRDQDAPEHSGQLIVWADDGTADTLPLAVRTRGNYRLQRRTCEFPPLRLNLKKKATTGSVFDGQDKLKLTTHCRDKDQFEQYILQEYLIYRLYNLFTPKSKRVRLATVTYVDTERADSVTRYGFLIENDDQMAVRNGMVVLDMPGIHQETTDHNAITLLSLFQYFIGNTDWSVSALHNINIIADERQIPFAVPFDFDWSGVIDAPYAGPDTSLRTRSVRDRVLISGCRTLEELAPHFARFNALRDSMYALIRTQVGLEPKTVKETIDYLDEFFRIINDPRRAQRELVRRCPGT